MADATTVVEGKIKFREGKKWKPRWCLLKKPSPVADQLQIVLYKDVSHAVKDEAKPKNILVLEAFFGLDAGIAFDKEAHVLAIICQKSICLMAFEQRENMIQFEIKIRQSLGEEHQFPVTVVKAPSSSRLLKDQVRLVIHDLRFCLVAYTPPKILLSWNIEDLRRFGATDNKFCFEGGSRCGKGTGVFAIQSEQAKDIEDIVHLASIGKVSNVHRKFKNRRRLSSCERLCPPYKVTALTLPVDVVQRSGADNFTVLWSQRSITCQNFLDNSLECTHPAKTVLRPRSGQEYVLIKRKAKLLTTSHLNSSCNQFFTFEPEHNDALSVLSSLSTPQNSPSFSSADNTMNRLYPDLGFSQPAALSSCSSLNLLYHNQSSFTVKDSACKTELTGDVFFPADAHFNSSPPPSPFHQKFSLSPQVHYPIYVNQEFTVKHQHPLTSFRTISTSSSQSSISPSRTSMLSLKSSLLSPKLNSNEVLSSQQKKNLGLRHSEPVPGKFENLSFSLPRSQGPSLASSFSNVAKYCPELHTSDSNKMLKKEYDKFANSVIIARRRNQCSAFIPEDHQPTEDVFSSHLLLQLPQIKSSGYKNIDSFNLFAANDSNSALTEINSSSTFTLPRVLGKHPSADINSNPKTSVSSMVNDSKRLPDVSLFSVCDEFSDTRDSLPYLCNPPPPVRRRHASSSSSSLSSSTSLTPGDCSDSPPSYYAPSPPYTPPALPIISSPPAIPPRQRLLPPTTNVVPSSPSERNTDSSDDEPELNYIEVDMTKTSSELIKPAYAPAVYYRPNKRTQKKEKDSAKLRYVEIDHRATKALQEARQEHVQARDGTQVKSANQLNRINSAPASSKKKHFTFISRERKLSSGSIESC